jgi:hypothetical protein
MQEVIRGAGKFVREIAGGRGRGKQKKAQCYEESKKEIHLLAFHAGK